MEAASVASARTRSRTAAGATDNGCGRRASEGKATSRAPYERFETIFSNVRARYDAENRAARTVAESIKVRIAAYLSQSA